MNTLINEFEQLELRRLLSFAPVGVESVISDLDPSAGYALAVAGDGQFIVVSKVVDLSNTSAVTSSVQAVRYSASGEQLGEPITIEGTSADGSFAVDMDADGDAVIAYTKDEND